MISIISFELLFFITIASSLDEKNITLIFISVKSGANPEKLRKRIFYALAQGVGFEIVPQSEGSPLYVTMKGAGAVDIGAYERQISPTSGSGDQSTTPVGAAWFMIPLAPVLLRRRE